MAGNLRSPEDGEAILSWIDSGAKREIYQTRIAPILQRDCLGCHSPASGMNVPPLTRYQEVVKLTEADRGASIPSLVRVSHIHLFGIAFILFFVGKLFILCDIPVWIKRLTIGIPFLSMLVDILAWYLTREIASFAYLLVLSGALMGMSLNFQIWLSLFQMWFPNSYRRIWATVKDAGAVFFRQGRDLLKRKTSQLYAWTQENWPEHWSTQTMSSSSRRIVAFLYQSIRRFIA
nr:hypothetical protein [Methylomarinum sp. Ch1-1]MDP4520983.1 hypothetical protein [Methylomarinum sp. Ch1-1]